MSAELEDILTTNPLRERWFSLDEAVEEVVRFEQRFGPAYLRLACHAALPFLLTPELLNLIRINFLEEREVPWYAEADLLLSPLCHSAAEQLYQVEPAVREVLLDELERQEGPVRLEELARFLLEYLKQSSASSQPRTVRLTQQWIGMAYLDPDSLLEKLNNSLTRSLEQSSAESSRAGLSTQLRIAQTLELVSGQLERTLTGSSAPQQARLQYLRDASRILSHYWYGNRQQVVRQAQKASQAGQMTGPFSQVFDHLSTFDKPIFQSLIFSGSAGPVLGPSSHYGLNSNDNKFNFEVDNNLNPGENTAYAEPEFLLSNNAEIPASNQNSPLYDASAVTVPLPTTALVTLGNPYTDYDEQGGVFYRREDILAKVVEHCRAGTQLPIFLYGGERTGKSWILNNLDRGFDSGTTIVWVNLRIVSRAANILEFYKAFASQLYEMARDNKWLSPQFSFETFRFDRLGSARNSLRDLFEQLNQQRRLRQRFIIAFDNYELLETGLREGKLDQHFLVDLGSFSAYYPWLVLIFSGQAILEVLGREFQEAFGSIAEQIKVGNLNRTDAEQGIRHPQRDFPLVYEDALVDRLYQLTGGQPYLLTILCSELLQRWKAARAANPTHSPLLLLTDLEALVNEPDFYHKLQPYLTNYSLLFNPTAKAILVALAKAPAGLRSEELVALEPFPEEVERVLKLLQYRDLISATSERGPYKIAVELYQNWLLQSLGNSPTSIGDTSLPTPSTRSEAWPSNPFTLAVSVPVNRFVGREKWLHKVRRNLETSGSSLLILGEPKLGKSSVLNLLYRELRDQGYRAVLGSLRNEDIKDIERKMTEVVGLTPSKYGWPLLRERLIQQPFYLFLDDFDRVFRLNAQQEWQKRLNGLTSQPGIKFKLIVAARQKPPPVWYKMFFIERLLNFTKAEADQLLMTYLPPEVGEQIFLSEVRRELFELTKGHPFKLTRAAFHYYDHYTNEPSKDWRAAYNEDITEEGLFQ